jgi:transcription-repair coupling factor (superfamily II helicase)
LTPEASRRLKAIEEFSELGAGFSIAMRDLEIRGAGNLLGGEQSGHIAAVGFDLYCQLVTEAVGELKGEEPAVPLEITIDLPVQAHLPKDYVSRDDVRMEAYRRLAAVTEPADVDDVREEWDDRYGAPPPAAAALLDLARLRVECVRLGIRSITMAQRAVRIRGLELKASQEVRLKRLAPGARVSAEEAYLPWTGDPNRAAAELVVLLEGLVPRETTSERPMKARPIGSAAP